jgi:hypothetical protein
MLLNGATQIEETAFPFPLFALLHLEKCMIFKDTFTSVLKVFIHL